MATPPAPVRETVSPTGISAAPSPTAAPSTTQPPSSLSSRLPSAPTFPTMPATTSTASSSVVPSATTHHTEQELLDVEAEVEAIHQAQERQLERFKGLNASLVKKLRKAEVEAATLLNENKLLEQKNADLVHDLRTTHSTNQALIAEKHQELADTQVNLSAAQKDLMDAQHTVHTLRTQLRTLQEDHDAVRDAHRRELAQAVQDADKSFAEKQAHIETLTAENAAIATQLNQVSGHRDQLLKQSEDATAQIAAGQSQNASLTKELDTHKANVASLAEQLATLTEERRRSENALAELNTVHARTRTDLETTQREKAALQSRHDQLNVQFLEVTAAHEARKAELEQAKKDAEVAKLAHDEQLKKQLELRDANWVSKHRAFRTDLDNVILKHSSPESVGVFELPAPPPYSTLVGGAAAGASPISASSAGLSASGMTPAGHSELTDVGMATGNTIESPAMVPAVVSYKDLETDPIYPIIRDHTLNRPTGTKASLDLKDSEDIVEHVDDEVPLSQEEAARKRKGLFEMVSPVPGTATRTHEEPVGGVGETEGVPTSSSVVGKASGDDGIEFTAKETGAQATGTTASTAIETSPKPELASDTHHNMASPTVGTGDMAAELTNNVTPTATTGTSLPVGPGSAKATTDHSPIKVSKKPYMERVREMFKSCCAAPPTSG